MADSFSFSDADQFDVVVTYSAAQQTVQAVEGSGPGWHVVGGFEPSSNVDAKIEITGAVSLAGLILTARVWLVSGAASAQVGGFATLTGTTPASAKTADTITFEAGRVYQIQVQVLSPAAVADTDFGIVHTVQLVP